MLAAALPLVAIVLASRVQADSEPLKVAEPRFSTVTSVLVGCPSGDSVVTHCPDAGAPVAGFVVTPRDINGALMYGHDVELSFAASNLRLYADQEAGCTFDCALRVMHKTVGLSGSAVFHPRFGGYSNAADVEVAADGVVLKDVPARSTDMDAQGGATGLGDFTLFAPLFLDAATGHPEADFDGSGGPPGLGDLAIFAREYLLSVHGSYCP